MLIRHLIAAFVLPGILSCVSGCAESDPKSRPPQSGEQQPGTPGIAIRPNGASAKAESMATAAGSRGITVDNPLYRSWSQFPVGTQIKQRDRAEGENYTTETTTTYRLESVDDTQVVLMETSEIVAPDGTRRPTEREVTHRRTAIVSSDEAAKLIGRPSGAVSEHDEELSLLGKTYPSKRYVTKGRVEAGETLGEVWIVEAIPGRIAKSIFKVPAAKRVVHSEIVEITVPAKPDK